MRLPTAATDESANRAAGGLAVTHHPSRQTAEAGQGPRPARMLVITAAWGTCFVAIRYGLRDAPVLWFAALRAVAAGGALLAVAAGTGRLHVPRPAWPTVAWLAVVNIAIAFAAMFAGTAGVATGVAAVLSNAQPLLIILPAWLFFHERTRPQAWVGLAVGFGGLIIAATPSGAGQGAVLSIAAAAAITVGTLLTRRLRGVDVLAATGWQFLLGGIVLVAWAAVVEGAPAVSWTGRFVGALTFLTLIGTVAPYLLWFVEVQRAPLLSVSAWTMLTPVIGVAAGAVVLGERLSARQLLGVTLVLTALPIILLRRRRTAPTQMADERQADPTRRRAP